MKDDRDSRFSFGDEDDLDIKISKKKTPGFQEPEPSRPQGRFAAFRLEEEDEKPSLNFARAQGETETGPGEKRAPEREPVRREPTERAAERAPVRREPTERAAERNPVRREPTERAAERNPVRLELTRKTPAQQPVRIELTRKTPARQSADGEIRRPAVPKETGRNEVSREEEENLTLAALVARRIAHRESSSEASPAVRAGRADERASGRTGAEGGRKKIGPALIAKRVLACLGTAVAVVLVFLIGVLLIINRGPSETFRNMFVMTVSESSAGDFLATWFLPKETVDRILAENAIKTDDRVTTGEKIEITTPAPDQKPFEIIEVSGKTFTGKMIIVTDPSRVRIGTPPGGYGESKEGMSTLDMAGYYNALAAVNGGGFYDTGRGNGGVPTGRENSDGIVISGGKMLWGDRDQTYEVIGINKENKLILGKMTGGQALDSGILEALNFGPYLIMDGEPCVIGSSVTEGGLNPRTAIAQRKDGAMLLLVVNGRQANSLGASYDDLIALLLEHGAVNAANLDGGSSSYMVYENEIITTCASLYGPRKMATSILVSR